MVSPDDTCAVCMQTRENHGDANHEFDLFDSFPRPKRPAEPPRQAAPKERGEPKEPNQAIMDSFMALLEKLIEKGILDAKDIVAILAPRG